MCLYFLELQVSSARQYTKNSYGDLTPFQAMMMKSGLEKSILKFHGGLQRYLLTCQANSAFLGRFFCTGQPPWNFKIIFSRPLFIIVLSQKQCQISVRIFCVLSGNKNLQCWGCHSTASCILNIQLSDMVAWKRLEP